MVAIVLQILLLSNALVIVMFFISFEMIKVLSLPEFCTEFFCNVLQIFMIKVFPNMLLQR